MLFNFIQHFEQKTKESINQGTDENLVACQESNPNFQFIEMIIFCLLSLNFYFRI